MSKWYIDNGLESDVVVSSRIRLARNVEGFKFPHKTNQKEQEEIINLVKEAILQKNGEGLEQFSFIEINKLSFIEKQELIEKHIISKELASYNRFTGVILSEDERISVMINEEDHLRIQCLASGLSLNQAWDTCSKIDKLMQQKVDFAFNQQLGYLTCCPTNIGTALRASVMLHLPALTLTGYIRTILDACGKLGIAVRGLYGENSEAYSDMYQMSNQITLGKSEEDIILNIKNITYQILEQERLLRKELLSQNTMKLEDRIFRSYAVLKSARLMTAKEGLKRISDVRLGIELGLIKDINLSKINEALLSVQPGGLQKKAEKLLKPNESDKLRASTIRQLFGAIG